MNYNYSLLEKQISDYMHSEPDFLFSCKTGRLELIVELIDDSQLSDQDILEGIKTASIYLQYRVVRRLLKECAFSQETISQLFIDLLQCNSPSSISYFIFDYKITYDQNIANYIQEHQLINVENLFEKRMSQENMIKNKKIIHS